MPLAEDMRPCTTCGERLLWGTRHPQCWARARDAAAATLEKLGYTYHGGELWKPPIGPRPAWLDASGVDLPAPRRWIERWFGSGHDRGWWVWEANHGDSIAYCGEGDFAERLCSLIVQKHNEDDAAASGVPAAARPAHQPYAIEGLVAAVAVGNNPEIAVMFDKSEQAHGFVNYLKRFIEPKRTAGVALPRADQQKGGA